MAYRKKASGEKDKDLALILQALSPQYAEVPEVDPEQQEKDTAFAKEYSRHMVR